MIVLYPTEQTAVRRIFDLVFLTFHAILNYLEYSPAINQLLLVKNNINTCIYQIKSLQAG